MERETAGWRKEVEECFFKKHLSIKMIADRTGISRQSISVHLKQHPAYREERERRKKAHAEARKEYKRDKNREYRAMGAVTSETIRREHDVAALILSREKYH